MSGKLGEWAERPWGQIKDPLHGYINITELDKRLIDSEPVQRLRRIRQLAGSEYVYPAANHTRFEHSLGVMYLAERLSRNPKVAQFLGEKAEEVKIAALLHDVGHGPFSHVFESLLERVGKTHEDMSTWIIAKSLIADLLEDYGYNAKEIAKMAVGRSRDTVASQIIRSAIDVDKMDFIIRDSYHTGAGYGNVDVFRIIDSIDVIGNNLVVNVNSIPALEAFIIARVELFRAVYFHRTSRATQTMLTDALLKANEELNLTDFSSVSNYLRLDDYTTWSMLERCDACKETIEMLKRRDLLKCCYNSEFYTKKKIVPKIFSDSEVRKRFQRKIADLSGVPFDKIFIDVPTLPSVPYQHSIQLEPMEIPVYREEGRRRITMRASEMSPVIGSLKMFLNILRVYTEERFRSKVGKGAQEVFGKAPFSLGISF